MDCRTRALNAKAFITRGDAIRSADYLTAEMAEGDPLLMLAIAEIQLRAGHLDAGLALAEQVLAAEPSSAGTLIRLGLELATQDEDAGFLLVEMGAQAWMTEGRWSDAAGAFAAFTALRLQYVPASVRLHEIAAGAEEIGEQAAIVLPFRRLRTA